MNYQVLIVFTFATVFLSIAIFEIIQLIGFFYPEIVLERETWWGKGDPSETDNRIHPFKINVSQEVLDDLKYRLEHTRPFTNPLEANQWYGFNGDLAQDILYHWKTKYDWRRREKYLNKYEQFITNIQGLRIHYVHVKPKNIPKHVKVLPLLMVHGWPGSVREFYEIIPYLTSHTKNQSFVFEVIAPHLPGYAFSESASIPGLGAAQTAVIFKNLMNKLGFQQFYVQGGDLGSIVLQSMSIQFKESILGFHSNFCLGFNPMAVFHYFLGSFYPSWIVRKDHMERVYPVTNFLRFILVESGYLHLQATKSDTIGIAIDDSPMGLAAYNLEKFVVGTDFDFRNRADGGLKLKYKYDDLLDIVMLYWINKCATTAYRFYAETFNAKAFPAVFWISVQVPTVCARFKSDIYTPDGMLPYVYHKLVRITDYDTGHFAAFENPELLAYDIFEGIAMIEGEENTHNTYK